MKLNPNPIDVARFTLVTFLAMAIGTDRAARLLGYER